MGDIATLLMAAVEHATESILITDEHGSIKYVNTAFAKTTGFSQEEAINQNPRILKSKRHDDAFYEKMWSTLVLGKTWTGQVVNKRKGGDLYTARMSISPIPDTSGRTAFYVAVQYDITKELELKGQLIQSQKHESIGRMLTGVAHEQNNCLQIIMGELNLIQLKVKGDNEISKSVERALSAVRLAGESIDQLLLYAGKTVSGFNCVDINTIVKQSRDLIKTIGQGRVTYSFQLMKGLPRIMGSDSHISQVLMNLVNNAAESMESGNVKVSTGIRDVIKGYCCTWGECDPGKYIFLRVQDNGSGMSQEVLGKIFDPFFTTKAGNPGFGMAAVLGVVQAHGACIKIKTEVGFGTTFTILFREIK